MTPIRSYRGPRATLPRERLPLANDNHAWLELQPRRVWSQSCYAFACVAGFSALCIGLIVIAAALHR